MYFAIVTLGTPAADLPRQAYYFNLSHAVAHAACLPGSGSCTAARVYQCSTLALARTADIAVVRSGETIIRSFP